MQLEARRFAVALRMVPLLRSIAAEITERNAAVAVLEQRLNLFSGAQSLRHPEVHADVQSIETDLAAQRRELRRVESELRGLGWTLDDSLPREMMLVGFDGTVGLSWRLEDTGFYRRPAGTPSR
jgi:hypothetical protein